MSRQTTRREILHRKKLFGGRYTAEEYHSKYAFPPGASCTGCGRKDGLKTRFITLAPLDELRKRDPMFDLLASDPRGAGTLAKMLVQIRGAENNPIPYVRLSTVYACGACTPAAEKVAAKGPSWVQIEINRGPGTVVPQVGYTGAEGDNPLIESVVERYSQRREETHDDPVPNPVPPSP